MIILYSSQDLTPPRGLTNACGINIMKMKLTIIVSSIDYCNRAMHINYLFGWEAVKNGATYEFKS